MLIRFDEKIGQDWFSALCDGCLLARVQCGSAGLHWGRHVARKPNNFKSIVGSLFYVAPEVLPAARVTQSW
jgi:hypothetical protein